MYQSIPKRVYTTKESAMPKIPIQRSVCADRTENYFASELPKKSKLPKLPKNIETDDLLLIGLLLLLISEEGDNQLLIAVVAFLLFS